jgi:hypothetical protein
VSKEAHGEWIQKSKGKGAAGARFNAQRGLPWYRPAEDGQSSSVGKMVAIWRALRPKDR